MKAIWISIKFIYLYLAYWLVGLTEDDFYITKGHYFAELGKYYSAIKSYEKALKEEETPSLYASIGWCYATVEENLKALEYYRKAYRRIKRHYVTIPLATLEMECGNVEQCKEVFKNIKEKRDALPEESIKFYDQVKDYLENSEIVNQRS